MKKLLTLLIVAVLVLGSVGCGQSRRRRRCRYCDADKIIRRWVADGDNMVKEFEALGYTTDLQYAEDVVENQVAQIENMITKGVKVMVVASIDGESLTDVLSKAADEGIQVVAYDLLFVTRNM